MARNTTRRVNSGSDYYNREQLYISGNTARQLDYEPRKATGQEEHHKKTVSAAARKNRVKAMRMGKGYVLFLAVVSAIALVLCVNYLQLRSQLTTQLKEIAAQESELSTLKADNDALYNTVIASVDLEQVKETAINKLGMQYPTEDQIITFGTAGNSYVRQYEDVPESE